MKATPTMSLRSACARLASGTVSATALTRGALAHIAERNGELNAYWQVATQSALASAARSDERIAHGQRLHALDGIPVSIKDSIAVAGLQWTGGFAHRRELTADVDAHVVQRLRKQGAVILGKTSLDEGSFGTSGVNRHFGDCVHPDFPGYSAGGSSSGAAVSVASGTASYALGTDGMGSVRIPAALCGVAGFKPSFGRVSQRGVLPGSRRLDCVGVLAGHVADLQLPYHAIAGLDAADAQSRLTPLRHLEPDHWRMAVVPAEQLPNLSNDIAAVYAQVIAQLQTAPALATDCSWAAADLSDYDFARARRDGLLMMCAEMAAMHADALQQQPGTFSPWLRDLLEFPIRRSSVELLKADRRIDAVVVRARQWFAVADVLLLPTTPEATHPLSSPSPAHMLLTITTPFAPRTP